MMLLPCLVAAPTVLKVTSAHDPLLPRPSIHVPLGGSTSDFLNRKVIPGKKVLDVMQLSRKSDAQNKLEK